MKITGRTGPRGNRNFCSAEAILLQYGLTLIVLWIGAMKFTAYEAEGIRPLAENSPWMSWLVAALDIRGILGGFPLCQRTIVSVADGSGLCSGRRELLARWARRNTSDRPAFAHNFSRTPGCLF